MYIPGTFIRFDGGSEYEGVIYSLFLRVQTKQGVIVRLFDGGADFKDLIPGADYEFVVGLFVPDKQISVKPSHGALAEKETLPLNDWNGIVRQNPWSGLQSSQYDVINDMHRYADLVILVETFFGGILVPKEVFRSVVTPGDLVALPLTSRYDLQAVL